MRQDVEISKFERNVNAYLSQCICWDTKKNQFDLTRADHKGLFSNCTVTLWALTSKYPSDRFVRVNWPGQGIWRNSDQAGKNLFDLYFEQNTKADTRQLSHLPPIDSEGVYSALSFDRLTPYMQNYFVPSNAVRKKQEELVSKYNIDYEKTVALWYRGTDKWIQLSPIPPRYYLLETLRLLANDPDLRVLVQTDQEQVRDMCMSNFEKRAFYFDELPVTSSVIGVHHIPAESRGVSNFQFGITLLAVANIIARCRYVVMSTGNLGLWACLYRGTAKNTAQFRPRPPDLISNYEEKGESVNMAMNPNRSPSLPLSENYELRLENSQLRFELNAIKNSVIFRCVRFFALKIERL